MGIVNELQISAENDDAVTVLRKAKRLSFKLGRKDISEWVEHELNGYPNNNELPVYRNVPVSLCYDTNGYIPAGCGMSMSGILPVQRWLGLHLTRPIVESISE